MFKWNAVNIATIVIAGSVIAGVVYINSSTLFFRTHGDTTADSPAVPVPPMSNPLLTAGEAEVSRWFPGTCFAEIYMDSSSYGGALVQGCIEQTSREIRSETGAKLMADDFIKPEVISHFKSVYGAASWRS
jgi:hypothetical protein